MILIIKGTFIFIMVFVDLWVWLRFLVFFCRYLGRLWIQVWFFPFRNLAFGRIFGFVFLSETEFFLWWWFWQMYDDCLKSKDPYFSNFFFRQHWNKPPRGECSGGLYNHSVKIWRLYVCFSLCCSLVKMELSLAGTTKFEMCV